MIRTFYIENSKVSKVKSLVRKHNLYHVNEPFELFSKTEFKIEGDNTQFNVFDAEYMSLFPEDKDSFVARIKNWLGG